MFCACVFCMYLIKEGRVDVLCSKQIPHILLSVCVAMQADNKRQNYTRVLTICLPQYIFVDRKFYS